VSETIDTQMGGQGQAGVPDVDEAAACETWRECAHCGLIVSLPPPQLAYVAECPRCTHRLWKMRGKDFRFPLACGMAAALFYLFALVAPFLEISAYGRFQLATLSTGPVALYAQGFEFVAVLVLAVSAIFPGIKLGILIATLIGIRHHLLPRPLLRRIFRLYAPISPWAMIDVYLLGFLVAFTRLSAIAEVHLDTALFALIGCMITMALADARLDPEAVWRALDDSEPVALQSRSVIGCHACGMMNDAQDGDLCRRCHAPLHHRKRASLTRAWAFLLSAALFYIPANLYPVMIITQAARTQNFTIMGGIAELADYGLWPLAALVFFASILIPLSKILMLAAIMVQTRRRETQRLMARTKAFRFIDFIGRWSMIDVFMISILVALVRFGQFANIQADVGAPCFAAVVVLTLFAAEAFDPRLMWDNLKQ
jgi:paraquat-inducible protein A